ncbi:MAG: hypothetical protein NC301_05220 [Bacteroides sp.]|nr:hypothetical protein [Bacteroides sp.]MCM1379837.1 hypothetical protein [Bacteroides sp.]MCM1446196.1 hypothetical protein [Prevotella sp.]
MEKLDDYDNYNFLDNLTGDSQRNAEVNHYFAYVTFTDFSTSLWQF